MQILPQFDQTMCTFLIRYVRLMVVVCSKGLRPVHVCLFGLDGRGSELQVSKSEYVAPRSRSRNLRHRPKEPSHRDRHLESSCNPERYLHAATPLRNKPSSDGPGKQYEERRHTPIPLHIILLQQSLVRRNIMQHARNHHRRHLTQPKRSTPHNLSRALKTQQRDGYACHPINVITDIIQIPIHHPTLYQRRRQQYNHRLHHKRDE